MKYYKTKQEAELAAEENNYLIGQRLLHPYSALPITSITIEKAKRHQGFIVILSHDIFDGGWPEVTNQRCPQVELNYYLSFPVLKFL